MLEITTILTSSIILIVAVTSVLFQKISFSLFVVKRNTKTTKYASTVK